MFSRFVKHYKCVPTYLPIYLSTYLPYKSNRVPLLILGTKELHDDAVVLLSSGTRACLLTAPGRPTTGPCTPLSNEKSLSSTPTTRGSWKATELKNVPSGKNSYLGCYHSVSCFNGDFFNFARPLWLFLGIRFMFVYHCMQRNSLK